jgi:ABC-type multidrug transport system ATPase subunit
VIVGGNGSGKSTLLRILAGVTHPTTGTVLVPKAIGYVPERLAARSNLTGAEYVTHMGRIRGLDPKIVGARSRELFERLGLEPGPTAMIDGLSKGNKQKLVVAQAFLALAGLLVLDEPFSGLDVSAHSALSELMDEEQGKGTAILISAHRADPTVVADQMIHITGGRLAPFTGPGPAELSLDSDEQWIELVATPGAFGHEQIAVLLGVRFIRQNELGRTISAVVEQVHTDSILTAVISMGWSVRSVGVPGDNGISR